MKTVNVVAAIIEQNGKYFATQRGYGEFKDWWEFPGDLQLLEAENAKWLDSENLCSVKWLPADKEVAEILIYPFADIKNTIKYGYK